MKSWKKEENQKKNVTCITRKPHTKKVFRDQWQNFSWLFSNSSSGIWVCLMGKHQPHRSFIGSGGQEGSRSEWWRQLGTVCRRPLGRRWRTSSLQQNVTRVRMSGKAFPGKGFPAFSYPKALCNAVTIGCERDLPELLQVYVCSAEVKITS